jgi:hypothetical protein
VNGTSESPAKKLRIPQVFRIFLKYFVDIPD